MTKTKLQLFFVLTSLSLTFGFAPAVPAAVSVLDYYRLGEDDPGALDNGVVFSAKDSAGNNNLSVVGGPFWSTDVASSAVDHTVSVFSYQFFQGGPYGSTAVLTSVTDNFGIEAWVKPATTSGNHCIAYNGSTTASGWGLYQVGNTYRGRFAGVSVGSGSVTLNGWTHIALVRTNGVARLYVNGAAAGSSSTSIPVTPSGSFAIAAAPQNPTNEVFSGHMDEVRVFTFGSGQFSTADLLVNADFPPPTILAQSATGVTGTNATLNATVNPRGQSTTVYFQYGTTTSYGSFTSTNTRSGSVALGVSALTLSLVPNTIYHFRAVARNTAGQSLGSDVTFTNPVPRPQVTTLAASNITGSSASLNASINPGGAATSFYFQYGTTTNYGGWSATNNLAVGLITIFTNRTVAGLLPVTAYHFRVVASNSAGVSLGSDLIFTTATLSNLTVTTTNDSGVGSLRQAIFGAANTATINFSVTGVINLSSPLPIITNGISFNGPGAASLMISGASSNRIFFVDAPGAFVTISNITLADGLARGGDGGVGAGAGGGGLGAGGALFVNAGNVVASGVAFWNNAAMGGRGGDYGIAYNGGGGGGGLGGAGGSAGALAGGGGGGFGGRGGDALMTNSTSAAGAGGGGLIGNGAGSGFIAGGGGGAIGNGQAPSDPGSPIGGAGGAGGGGKGGDDTNKAGDSSGQAGMMNGGGGGGGNGNLGGYFGGHGGAGGKFGGGGGADETGNGGPGGEFGGGGGDGIVAGTGTGYGQLAKGGAGGFGGGGGGAGGGLSGNGGFGGGAGGGFWSSANVGAPGAFGGNGGFNYYAPAGAGGGGAALGGVIFVRATNSASVTLIDSAPDTGSVIAGSGGAGSPCNPGDSTCANAGPGTAAGSSMFLLGGTNTLTFNSGLNILFGTIGGWDGAPGVLIKNGSGTLALDAINSYSGQTLVNGGTLRVDGSIVSSSNVTVNSGATLSGIGSVGSLTLNTGGTLSPGASPGVLSAGRTVWTGAGNYNWQLYDAIGPASISYDMLFVNGTLDLSAAVGFKINLWTVPWTLPETSGNAINFTNNRSQSWTLVQTTGGVIGFNPANFIINPGPTNGTGGFANPLGAGYFTLSVVGNNLMLNFLVPPSATAEMTGPLTATNATLNGTVDPVGLTTTWYFQYGTTTNYGSSTATNTLGSTSDALSVASSITGLTPGTLYYFHLVAANSSGLAFSSNVTFTTVAIAPSVTTLAASSVTPTGSTFNASVNPNGAAGNAYFQLGSTTNYGSTTALIPFGATNVALSLSTSSGLSPGTLYHFRAVASNSVGLTFGADATLTTPASVPNVGTLAASSLTTTGAKLNATVNPAGSAGAYYFQFGSTTNYGSSTPPRPFVTGSEPMAVGEVLSGLNPGMLYHFRAVATNSLGTTFGNDAYFLLPHLPPVATTFAATNVAANSATLRGSVNPNGLPTRAYFEYGPNTNFDFATATNILPPSGVGLRFNGTDQAVAISNPVNLANLSFTVEAWTRRATTNRWDILLHQGTNGPNNYALHFGFRPQNTFTFAFWGNDLDTTNIYIDSDWHHWAGTFDALTHARTLYRDGVVVASDVAPTAYQGTNLLWIGRSPGLGSWFGGDLDEVRLWLGARSAADILQDMNGGVTGMEPGLLAAWRLDEGSGATVFDASANANSGALLNSPQWLTAASLTQTITNLQPLTTYYCRVVGENDTGITYGNDVSFFTPAPAPTVTTLPASSIILSSAQLNGTATPNNWPQSAFFEYGPSTAYRAATAQVELSATNITFPLSAQLTNLLPGTFYHFRAAATNGTSGAAGADATFTTLVAIPTSATLPATGVAARSAVLNGNVAANGLLTRCYFDYGLTTNYGQTSATNFVPPSASALRFDGLSQSVTTSKSLNLSNVSFSVEAWARRAAPGLNNRLVQQGANGVVNNTLHFGFRANDLFTFGFWGNDLDTTNTYTDSNWHHWAATFDATTLARRIYRDGQLAASDTAADTYQGTNAFLLGGSPITGTLLYGDLDEVRIWSGVRSQADIAFGMTTNATGLEPALLACWRFDEGSGDSFTADSTPNGNHATLVNFPLWINPVQQATYLAGLPPASFQHFRMVVLNSLGASVGDDLTFTTGPDVSVATTLPPSSVGTTTATLNASVELAGAATTVYFEYGPVSSGFVASTASTVFSATNDTVPLSVPVTGLAPATFYQVRAVASNSVGVSYGTNHWFTTMLSPPFASTLPVDGRTTNAATLHGAIEHKGSITRYYFEYGTDTNYGQFTATNVMRPIGAALRFNGTNQSVTISNSLPLIGRSFAIEAWVRRAAANRNDFFLQHNSSAFVNGALHLGFRANNYFTFAFWGNDLNTTNTYTDTDWHHWAATFDSTSRVRTIYRDGIPVASDISPSLYQANTVIFLGYSPPNNSWFGGDLDEVRVWDGVRTAAQIVGGMTTNVLGSETNLLACWRLDEASGSFTGDSSLNGHNGSLINSPTWLTPAAPAEPLAGLQPGTVYHYRLVAFNGAGISYGSDMIFTTDYAFVPAPQLNPPVQLVDGSVLLSFTSIPGAPFSVLATTNIALPVSQWELLGPASETPGGSGQFQFTDPQATNFTQRFYLLRAP